MIKFKSIYNLIPKDYKKESVKFISYSIANVLLDLVSVAYLVPLFVFILDKDKIPNEYRQLVVFSESYVYLFPIIFLIVFVLKNYLQIRINNYQIDVVFNMGTKISSEFVDTYLNTNYTELQKKNKGDSMQRIQMVGTDFSNHILLSISAICTEVLVIICIIGLSLFFFFKFTLIVTAYSLLSLFLIYKIRKSKTITINALMGKSYAKLVSDLLNIIDGLVVIKSFKKGLFFKKRYKESLHLFNTNYANVAKQRLSSGRYLEVTIVIMLCVLLYYTSYFMPSSSNKVLFVSFFAGISLKLFPSLNKIINAITNFKSFEYTIDLLEKNTPQNEQPKKVINSYQQSIELKNIAFGFTKDQLLLSNINLKIKKAQIIGIQGKSGVGKTTLLNIIMNLITPTNGAIVIDGSPVSLDVDSLNFIAYTPQQPFLFNGTLLENIVMGAPSHLVDMDKIKLFITAFELDDLINNLKDGFNTHIQHDSTRLSGGQKQRIAIIRALYTKATLLIFDEITSQLNAELEMKVMKYIRDHVKKENKSMILVSHAATIKDICDEMYTIENGKIALLQVGNCFV